MTDALRRIARTLGRSETALARPVDGAWLAAFRVLFGLAMCVSMVRFVAYGWVDTLFLEPRFHFKYWGFEWVEALPPAAMRALFWVLAALALGIAVGFRFRLCACLFALGFVYLELVDVANYLNHYYLAGLLAALLALSPAHRSFSVDARLEPALASQVVPRFWLYLLRFQVGVVYTFAGLAKAHGDWLLHAQPLRIWLGSHTDSPFFGPIAGQVWAAPLMSWAGFLFDTTIVGWLLYRRTRPFAYAVLIVFHVVVGMLFPIGMFPVIMIISGLVFFEPDWARRVIRSLRRVFGVELPRFHSEHAQEPSVSPHHQVSPSSWRRAALALAVGYCVLQVALPLRFLAYGGNVRWHEQGMRFSWRVMVREKNGSVTFIVRHKQTGRTWHVSPTKYLTGQQEREMSGQPDLIAQLARYIRDDFEKNGRGPVEVRVDAVASLNGRRLLRLVDPDVDLSRVGAGVAPARWILPAPDEPPPKIRPI